MKPDRAEPLTALTTCYLCGSEPLRTRASRTRDRDDVGVNECGQCGLVQASAVLSEISGYYENDYRDEFLTLSADEEARLHDADAVRRLKMLNATPTRILDVGAGDGNFLYCAREQGWQVAGIELFTDARQRLTADDIPCFRDAAQAVAAGTSLFDVITMFHVLEHVADPIGFLAGIKSLAMAETRLVIEVPTVHDPLLTIYDIPEYQQFYWQSPHLYYFSMASLRAVVERAGWRVEWLNVFSRYGLRNHLHWLNSRTPGPGDEFSAWISDKVDTDYRQRLADRGYGDTLWLKARLAEAE